MLVITFVFILKVGLNTLTFFTFTLLVKSLLLIIEFTNSFKIEEVWPLISSILASISSYTTRMSLLT